MITFFSRKRLLKRRWYFHVQSPNGEIVAPSEAYNSREARVNGLFALFDMMTWAATREQIDPYSVTELQVHDMDATSYASAKIMVGRPAASYSYRTSRS